MPDSSSILVVDDNEDFRALLRLHLRALPCIVSEARDGEEAVELYEKHDYDLIVMDVIMPLMDGVDAIAAIRKQEAADGRRSSIVALSGEDSEETGRDCLAAGADRVLIKPIDRKTLLGAVKEMLGG